MNKHFLWSTASILLLAFILLCPGISAAAPPPDSQIAHSEATPITYGSTTAGAIGTPGEIDTFTFSAAADDALLIRLSAFSGDLWPRIRLYNPDGQLIADEHGTSLAEIYRVIQPKFDLYLPLALSDSGGDQSTTRNSDRPLVITAPGTYTIQVSDGFRGTYTGSYSLFLQKLNPPAGAATIAHGQTVSGAIAYAAEMDAFSFQAMKDERIIISLSQTSGDIWPQVRLYDPDGILLRTEGGPSHSEIEFDVPRDGKYALLIGDGFRGAYSGSYSLFLQRLDQPAGATPISYGQTLNGAISYAAEMDAFTVDVAAGDRFLIGITHVSGDIWPQIRLYDPAGLPLAVQGGPTHSEIEHTAATAGTYKIFVADGFRGTYTGSYNLFIQRLNGPINAPHMTFGGKESGSISLPAEMDAYTFDAVKNDKVHISVAHTSGDIWPQIRLYDPDGLLLNKQDGPSSAEIMQPLPAAGRFTILVSDGFRGAYTGSYNLHLSKMP